MIATLRDLIEQRDTPEAKLLIDVLRALVFRGAGYEEPARAYLASVQEHAEQAAQRFASGRWTQSTHHSATRRDGVIVGPHPAAFGATPSMLTARFALTRHAQWNRALLDRSDDQRTKHWQQENVPILGASTLAEAVAWVDQRYPMPDWWMEP